jgi:hypothetical protein
MARSTARHAARLALTLLVASALGCGGGKPAASAKPPATDETPDLSGAADAGVGSSGPQADAQHVIQAMRPEFRACYEAALKKDAKVEGTLTLAVHVDAQGAVSSTTPTGVTTLPSELVDCLAQRIERGRFAPPGAPGNAGATINVPFRFEKRAP